MLGTHTIVEILMIFFIAFLLQSYISLIQEYEDLKASCHEKVCLCQSSQGTNLLSMQKSDCTDSLFESSSSLLLRQQDHGVHWLEMDNPSSPSDQACDDVKERLSSPSSISISYPPPEVILNPLETGNVVDTGSQIAESDANVHLGEITATTSALQTDEVEIPSIQSSVGEVLLDSSRVDKDIEKANSLHVTESVLEATPQKPTIVSLEVDGKEDVIFKGDDYRDYNLPIEQTDISAKIGLNDITTNAQIIIPSIKSTSETELSIENYIVEASKTVQHSSDEQIDLQVEKGDDIPMKTSSSLMFSGSAEAALPISTDINIEGQPDFLEGEHQSEYEDIHSDTKSDHQFSDDGSNKKFIEEPMMVTPSLKEATDEEKLSFLAGSSAKCLENGGHKKYCSLRNICYNPQKNDFIFFKGPDSKLDSTLDIAKSQNNSQIVPLSLSTLPDHNALTFSLITLPVDTLSKFSFSVITKKSIAISRFKPDNIMHVLHDDILPLYNTLKNFNFPSDAIIILTDGYEEGDYFDFYKSLSKLKPLLKEDFGNSLNLVCFSDIHIGLSMSTVWYDYGFQKPQGPHPNINTQAFSFIQDTANYLANYFHTDCFLCNQKDYLVFLSRKDNRLILNEGDLIFKASKATRLKVFSVSLETQSLAEIITIVKSSRGIIGMHGSLFIVSIFLPSGSVVIELFPYAVNASRYTPFRTFSNLQGSFLTYKSWANTDKSKSIAHPDRAPEEGGIRHLPLEKQREIEGQIEVPEHLCCSDPSWLYHIYQDTHVNVTAVASLIVDALQTQAQVHVDIDLQANTPTFPTSVPDVPGSVENLKCTKNDIDFPLEAKTKVIPSHTVSWTPHWGLRYYPSIHSLRYEVIAQEQDLQESDVSVHSIDVLSYSLFSKSSALKSYHVWVTVIVIDGSIRSQSKYVSCD